MKKQTKPGEVQPVKDSQAAHDFGNDRLTVWGPGATVMHDNYEEFFDTIRQPSD